MQGTIYSEECVDRIMNNVLSYSPWTLEGREEWEDVPTNEDFDVDVINASKEIFPSVFREGKWKRIRVFLPRIEIRIKRKDSDWGITWTHYYVKKMRLWRWKDDRFPRERPYDLDVQREIARFLFKGNLSSARRFIEKAMKVL